MATRLSDFNPLDSYMWGHLIRLAYSAPFGNEKTFHQRIFMPIIPFTVAQRTFKSVQQYVIRRVRRWFNAGEKILSICCEFRLDKQYE